MGTHELRVRLWSIVSALSKPTHELLRMLSVEHASASSKEGNEALVEVLNGDRVALKLIQSSSKDTQNDFYITKGKLKPKVNIDELDVQFVKDLLLSVEGFPTTRETLAPNCMVPSHKPCCSSCDHSGSKNNQCKTCKKYMSQCTVVCCKSCNICLNCHRASGGSCNVYQLIEALKIANDLRNVAAHTSDDNFEKFDKGTYQFVKFPSINDFKSLSILLERKAFLVMTDYMANVSNFKKSKSKSSDCIKEWTGEFIDACKKPVEYLYKKFGKEIENLIQRDESITENIKKALRSFCLRKFDDADDHREKIKNVIIQGISKKMDQNQGKFY